jgi:uncharacterized protein YjbJ (UPF0337 family)
MNRDELEGKAKALKGKIKQGTGDLTNNPRLHDEGVVDEVAGKAQGAVSCQAQGRRNHRRRRQGHEEIGVDQNKQITLKRVDRLTMEDGRLKWWGCVSARSGAIVAP